MACMNNKGDKIGSLDTAISNDNVVTINRLNHVTTVTVRDRDTGKVTAETFLAIRNLGGRRLLQLRVLRLGFLQDGDVGVGVFPESKAVWIPWMRIRPILNRFPARSL